MAAVPNISGIDGLMALSRREGGDIRPTLLRVLTDLYVQTTVHTEDEERQYVELASRLLREVGAEMRAAVRDRLSSYGAAPLALVQQLALDAAEVTSETAPAQQGGPAPVPAAVEPNPEAAADIAPAASAPAPPPVLTMRPADAAELSEMFFAASAHSRRLILRSLHNAPLKPAARITSRRLGRALENLEQAAFVGDAGIFATELGNILMLPTRLAERITNDESGEALACALRALHMPLPVFERILLFLDPELGKSVERVYRLSRLYETLSERSSLIMLAAFRGATAAAVRARYAPLLHDDERTRARSSLAGRPAVAPRADDGRRSARG